MSTETQIGEIIEIADARPTTDAERELLQSINGVCTSHSPSGWYCVRGDSHEGLHMATSHFYTRHHSTWGTAEQWGTAPMTTEMPTEDATTAFIYGKLHEPVAVNISDFSGYTATESREQYQYARRQLLDLADKYRQSEDDNAIALQVAQANLSTADANTAHYRRIADENQQDFTTFANMLLEEAISRGWCSDYEKFADQVNAVMKRNEVPFRTKEYTVTNTYTVTVSITVSARNEDDAIEIASGYHTPRFSDDSGEWYVAGFSDDNAWEAEAD